MGQFEVTDAGEGATPKALPVCPYDKVGCNRNNPSHFQEFTHPTMDKKRLKDRLARTKATDDGGLTDP